MTDDILDVAKWKKKYPFLYTIWNTYEEFDKPIPQEDTNKKYYDFVCDQIINDLGGDIGKHKPYCMQLIRNLGHYSFHTNYFNPTFERCNILYNWLYHSSNSEGIPDNIIEKCFKDYNDQIITMKGNYKCSYNSYKNMYLDPMKINILNIFDDNMKNLKNILISPDDTNKTHSLKFVCECVKIYKNVYKSYCNDTNPNDDKSNNTCGKLYTLKTIYDQYLFQNKDLMNKVPSLSGTEEEFGAICKADEQSTATTVVADSEEPRFPYSDKNRGKNIAQSFPSTEAGGENQVSPMSRTVSTAVGTVAGASSILALLYKFSPARRWVHSGIRGNSGRMNSNFYEDGQTELLFDAVHGEDMSSYNPSYNIGYGSV